MVLVGGLLAVRWVGTTLATPAADPRAATRLSEGSLSLPRGAPGSEAVEIAPEAVRAEALRLAAGALLGDDLEAARDLYMLAEAVMAGDDEALLRRQQVETALGIASRRDDWDSALDDLGELRQIAPASKVLLAAYVESLIGASREAQASGASARASALCHEAAELMPAHPGVRTCRAVTPSPALAPSSTPTPLRTPTSRPTAVPLTPAPPLR